MRLLSVWSWMSCWAFGWLLLLSFSSSPFLVGAQEDGNEDQQQDCPNLDAIEAELEQCQSTLSATRTEFAVVSQDLKEEWHEKVQQCQVEAEAALEDVRAQHLAEWNDAQQQHQSQAQEQCQVQLELERTRQKEQFEADHDEARQQWEEQHHERVRDLQQQHDDALQDANTQSQLTIDTAVQEAVNKVNEQYLKEKQTLLHQKSVIQTQLHEVQQEGKLAAQKYHRATSELLEARQQLHEQNELVRLYKAGWYRRWIWWPLQSVVLKLYKVLVEPLLVEIYYVGQPWLDPVYQHFVVPVVWPVVTLIQEAAVQTWQFLVELGEAAVQYIQHQWDKVCEEVPVQMQLAVNRAYPHVVAAFDVAYDKLSKWSHQVHNWYQDELLPRWQEYVQYPVQEFYENRWLPFANQHLVPIYHDHLVPFWKNQLVPLYTDTLVPWWNNKAQPQLVKVATQAQDGAVKYYGQASKFVYKTAQSVKGVPHLILDVLQYAADQPRASLEWIEWAASVVILGVVWRWCARRLWRQSGSSSRHKSSANGHPPAKQVRIQDPKTSPPRKKKTAAQRRGTPHPGSNSTRAAAQHAQKS